MPFVAHSAAAAKKEAAQSVEVVGAFGDFVQAFDDAKCDAEKETCVQAMLASVDELKLLLREEREAYIHRARQAVYYFEGEQNHMPLLTLLQQDSDDEPEPEPEPEFEPEPEPEVSPTILPTGSRRSSRPPDGMEPHHPQCERLHVAEPTTGCPERLRPTVRW